MVEDNLFKLLVYLLLLSENDISFSFDRGGLEFRILEDVGEDIDCLWDVVIERLCVVNSVLALEAVSLVADSSVGIRTDVYALRWPPMFSISSSN